MIENPFHRQAGIIAKDLEELGFAHVPGAVAPDAVPMLLNALERAYAEGSVEGPLEILIPKIVEQSPVFASLALNPMILGVLSQTIGDDVHLIINQGHIKPPGTKSHTVLHSDLAHLRGVPHHLSTLMIKVMYFLTDVDEGAGGLLVYPGTHRKLIDSYPPKIPANVASRYLKVNAGDAVLFNPAILHTATNNVSGKPRLTLTYAYAHTWMRVFSGFEFGAPFIQKVMAMSDPSAQQIFGLTVPYTTYAAVAI